MVTAAPSASPLHRSAYLMLSRAAARLSTGAFSALLACVTAAISLPAGMAVASGVLIGRLSQHPGGHPGISVYALAVTPVVALGVLFLLQQILPRIASVWAEGLGRRLQQSASDRVIAAVQRPTGIACLEDPRTRQLLSVMDGGLTGAGLRDAVMGMVNIALVRGSSAACALVLLAYRWWLAPVMLVAYAYATTIVSRSYKRALDSAEGMPARLSRAMYFRDLMTTATAAKDIRIFGISGRLLDWYRGEWRSALHDTRQGRRGAGQVSLLAGAAVLTVQGLAMILLASDLSRHRISVGAFAMFTVAATGLLGMATVNPDLVNIASGGAILDAVAELEASVAPEDAADGAAGGRRGPASAADSVVFENVGFRYPGAAGWALRGLDLAIRPGTSTAVVGVNGAGKTTLVKLLCGLYQPAEGRILVNGEDLRKLDQQAWQRGFAGLFQDWVKWPLSLADNVTFGDPDRPADPAVLDAVAESCGLGEILSRLPDSWDTVLSREFGGTDLSGGQWQRVALARALWALSGTAGILLLDEPTSALDTEGEAHFNNRVLAATAGRTVLLISHRFSTVRSADRIVVLDGGRVLEDGDHASLMRAGGRYHEMFTAQAKHYHKAGTA
jgi:ABC-type multidrug transport system fused ATPase/permease subunit